MSPLVLLSTAHVYFPIDFDVSLYLIFIVGWISGIRNLVLSSFGDAIGNDFWI